MTRIEALVRIKGRVLEPRTLFVEHGYVATTIRDVARAAGVGERTVYGIFPSKADLFRHVLDVAIAGDRSRPYSAYSA
ncbi:MAG TPA: helix-turn-helix domain-containing protein [Trebonia sp.]|nr:helix-turn-helix domain-containing protein [Trebonia sp.]